MATDFVTNQCYLSRVLIPFPQKYILWWYTGCILTSYYDGLPRLCAHYHQIFLQQVAHIVFRKEYRQCQHSRKLLNTSAYRHCIYFEGNIPYTLLPYRIQSSISQFMLPVKILISDYFDSLILPYYFVIHLRYMCTKYTEIVTLKISQMSDIEIGWARWTNTIGTHTTWAQKLVLY